MKGSKISMKLLQKMHTKTCLGGMAICNSVVMLVADTWTCINQGISSVYTCCSIPVSRLHCTLHIQTCMHFTNCPIFMILYYAFPEKQIAHFCNIPKEILVKSCSTYSVAHNHYISKSFNNYPSILPP